jgi:hypothetical protein
LKHLDKDVFIYEYIKPLTKEEIEEASRKAIEKNEQKG